MDVIDEFARSELEAFIWVLLKIRESTANRQSYLKIKTAGRSDTRVMSLEECLSQRV